MHWFQRVADDFRQWHRNIRLFFVANLFYQIGSGMFGVLYNLYVESLGRTEQTIGSVISLQSLATALMFIPIGLLSDRKSRKTILIAGALFSGASLIARAMAEGESAMLSLAFFSGLFVSVFQVLAVPFLAENVEKEHRLQLFSYHFSFVLAAQVLGSVGGGYFADVLQTVGLDKAASLRVVLLIGGVATLAAVVPLFFIIDKKKMALSSAAAASPQAPTAESSDARAEWKAIGLFTCTTLLIGIGSGLVVPYLNLYFHSRFAMSLTMIGLLISLGQIMTIVSMLIGPSLVKRVGPVRAVVIFQLLSLPFLLLTGYTNLLLVAAVSFLFRQALMNAANPIQSSIIVDRISDSRRGIANSITQTAFMLGWASMGTVQSYLITTYGTYWGYAVTFTITGVLYVTSALIYFAVFREPKRQNLHATVKQPLN